ncbi:MAG: DnaJ family domain-containing protein [Eubacteriales bacterium]
MSDIYGKIAEAKIKEAIQKGELKNLPGEGKPLVLDVPNPFEDPEDRMYNKIMKNLGLLPEEVEIQKEIEQLKMMIADCKQDEQKVLLKKKLEETKIRYNIIMEERRGRQK